MGMDKFYLTAFKIFFKISAINPNTMEANKI